MTKSLLIGMVRRVKSIPQKTIWQILALLGLSCLMALAVNQLRDEKLPLIGNWSAEQRFASAAGQSSIISLQEAPDLLTNAKTLFLDARPRSEYLAGHIEGALNFPAQELDHHFMRLAERLEGVQTIVTYCDGEGCDLSHTLALFLLEMGFKDVRILVNGWSAWQQAGLPVKIGE